MPFTDGLGRFLWKLFKDKKITKAEYKKRLAESKNTTDTPAISKILADNKAKQKATEAEIAAGTKVVIKKESKLKRDRGQKSLEKKHKKLKSKEKSPSATRAHGHAEGTTVTTPQSATAAERNRQKLVKSRREKAVKKNSDKDWIQKMKDLDKE